MENNLKNLSEHALLLGTSEYLNDPRVVFAVVKFKAKIMSRQSLDTLLLIHFFQKAFLELLLLDRKILNKKLKCSYSIYDILWVIVDPQKLFVKRQQTPKADAHGPSIVPCKAVHSEKLRNFYHTYLQPLLGEKKVLRILSLQIFFSGIRTT